LDYWVWKGLNKHQKFPGGNWFGLLFKERPFPFPNWFIGQDPFGHFWLAPLAWLGRKGHLAQEIIFSKIPLNFPT